MEIKKCSQCGGNLERMRMQKAWQCPFCGARYEDIAQECQTLPAQNFGLNEEVFSVECDLSKSGGALGSEDIHRRHYGHHRHVDESEAA